MYIYVCMYVLKENALREENQRLKAELERYKVRTYIYNYAQVYACMYMYM